MPFTTICSGPLAAGTTAPPEAINTTSFYLGDKTVFGCGEEFSTSVLVVILYLVDQFCRVLKAYAHSNSFGLDVNTRIVEVSVNIAC